MHLLPSVTTGSGEQARLISMQSLPINFILILKLMTDLEN